MDGPVSNSDSDAATLTTPATSDSASAPAPGNQPRRWPWLLALIVLSALVILGFFAIHALRQSDLEQASMNDQAAATSDKVAALKQALEHMQQQQQQTSQRLDSANATNKVLREELLGMGERATLLEDAVARLAQNRMGGDTALRLNETEFLLTMGAARLHLYADPAATIAAFSLAEEALAGLEDPSLATLRQTLAEELHQLRNLPPDPREAIRSELTALQNQLAGLPAPATHAATTAEPSRLSQLLGRLVTVRRYDPDTSLLGPSQREAALATLALQLELAQVALTRPDEPAFRSALEQAANAIPRLFDRNDAKVADWIKRLEQVRSQALNPELPALGATLRELRNLRTVRRAQSNLDLPSVPAATDAAPRLPQLEPETGDHR